MGEINDNINIKNSILLARNIPVALVVGAAGFLGSHLVEKLLKKNIQVIGVDNFSTGKKDNLTGASRDKNFHLITSSAEDLSLNIERLDYFFIISEGGWRVENVLNLAKKYDSKIVLVSHIELYEREVSSNLRWFKEAESKIAKFAAPSKEDKAVNARVLRLSAAYGPRMHFRLHDPTIRLIQASLLEELQKESSSSEFSSRALYIEDAVNLIVKSMLQGSTALKIFDGSLLHPIKVSEIKQVLLDPLWYESRGFEPEQLPPWPTPNLEKTMNELHWKPEVNLVTALKTTIRSLKDSEVLVPKLSSQEERVVEEGGRKEESLKVLKSGPIPKIKPSGRKISGSFVLTAIALLVIFYGLIFPLLALGYGFFTFRSNLISASKYIQTGEFDKSLSKIAAAEDGLDQAKIFVSSLEVTRQTTLFNGPLQTANDLITLGELSAGSLKHASLGTKALYDSLKVISGEKEGQASEYLSLSSSEFAYADEQASRAQVLLDQGLKESLPPFLEDRVRRLSQELHLYGGLIKNGRTLSTILPQVIGIDSKKSYLILLQNNMELRPTGGFIGSVARVDFEGGKLKKLDVQDVYNIDGSLKIHVEPPKELLEDLGQKDWYLRDSNWEADFPSSARQTEWFYNQEVGIRVDGVVGLNLSAMEDLLVATGPLDLAEYNEKISSDNLFEKAISHSEQNFFAGSQAKKSFITSLANTMLNKMFFSHKQDWPKLASSLGKSLEGKQMLIYLSDPKLFSYMVSQNWAGALPRPAENKAGEMSDLLSVVEANLGANKANFYLDRTYRLDTTIGKDGEVNHRLKINYTNRSPGNTWPAGKYKNRLRIYLPFGAKLNRALWGESDITKGVTTFADYGRSGYSMLVELEPKEQKSLVLDWTLPTKLQFKSTQSVYSLDIIKQPGTLKDPFEWVLTYPINYQISGQGKNISPQEHTISTDLSVDRRFEVSFKK